MSEQSAQPAGSGEPESREPESREPESREPESREPESREPDQAGDGPAAPARADGSRADGSRAAAEPEQAVPTGTDQADDDLKARFRQAMAAKHGSSGAQHQTHGDQGPGGHTRRGGSTSRMFRRKSG